MGGGRGQKSKTTTVDDTINHSLGNRFRQDDHCCKCKGEFKIKSQQDETLMFSALYFIEIHTTHQCKNVHKQSSPPLFFSPPPYIQAFFEKELTIALSGRRQSFAWDHSACVKKKKKKECPKPLRVSRRYFPPSLIRAVRTVGAASTEGCGPSSLPPMQPARLRLFFFPFPPSRSKKAPTPE